MNSFSIFYSASKKKFIKYFKPAKIYFYYLNKREDILSDSVDNISIDYFLEKLKQKKIGSENEDAHVFHLTYEFGHLFKNNRNFIKDLDLLAIEVVFTKWKIINVISNQKDNPIEIIELETVRKSEYKNAFNKVYENLLNGNCYQINLTNRFVFKFQNSNLPKRVLSKFFYDKDRISAYAHATYISEKNFLLLSNSPECLFDINKTPKGYQISTRPIKGTLPCNDFSKKNKVWIELKKSKKDEAELNMITDLMRNDLTSISNIGSRVEIKKSPLYVHRILHQYSKITADLPSNISLYKILSSIYPGGSITGAPKKRVMELIHSIEKNDRGFYTGSTILFHREIRSSSINIRTAEIDFNSDLLRYGSGGGITLLSESEAEYNEQKLKLQSFKELFS